MAIKLQAPKLCINDMNFHDAVYEARLDHVSHEVPIKMAADQFSLVVSTAEEVKLQDNCNMRCEPMSDRLQMLPCLTGAGVNARPTDRPPLGVASQLILSF